MLKTGSDIYCGEPTAAECNECIAGAQGNNATDIFTWRRQYAWLFREAARVLCPSQDVIDRLRRFGVGDRAVLAPHEPAGPKAWVLNLRSLRPDEVMRVAVIGVLAPHKGLHLFEELVRATDRSVVEYMIIGFPEHPLADDIRDTVVETGKYEDPELPGLLRARRPHVILFPGRWPETYSYTLSAALRAGIPLICGDVGAIASRTRGRPWTMHVDLSADVGGWLDALLAMRDALINNRWTAPVSQPSTIGAFYPQRYLRAAKSAPRKAQLPVLLIPDRYKNGVPTPCGYIRLVLPYDDLAGENLALIDLVNINELQNIRGAAVICQRHVVQDDDDAKSLLKLCKRRGMQVIYDLDDDLLNVPPGHEEAARLRGLTSTVRRMVEGADVVTVSTPLLAERIARIRDGCLIQHNVFDERLWPSSTVERSREPNSVRILYLGTTTHNAEYAMLVPVVDRIKARYGDSVEFDIIGMTSKQLPSTMNRIIPPSTTYPAFIRWLSSQRRRWHIGIAPLLNTSFNRVKSNIKILDYTGLGLATLASNVVAYQGTVADAGGVALVSNTFDEWVSGLSALIESEQVRSKLMTAADAFIRNFLTTAQGRQDRLRALRGIAWQ